jgi:hypothetical protein
LAIASTPVRALHPAAKAWRTSSTPTVSRVWVATCGVPGAFRCGARGWINPIAITIRIAAMNARVGTRKARAPSARPRRLRKVITASMARQMGRV